MAGRGEWCRVMCATGALSASRDLSQKGESEQGARRVPGFGGIMSAALERHLQAALTVDRFKSYDKTLLL